MRNLVNKLVIAGPMNNTAAIEILLGNKGIWSGTPEPSFTPARAYTHLSYGACTQRRSTMMSDPMPSQESPKHPSQEPKLCENLKLTPEEKQRVLKRVAKRRRDP
jgi:hypothetical protein